MKLILEGTQKEIADFVVKIQSQPYKSKEPYVNEHRIRGAKMAQPAS